MRNRYALLGVLVLAGSTLKAADEYGLKLPFNINDPAPITKAPAEAAAKSARSQAARAVALPEDGDVAALTEELAPGAPPSESGTSLDIARVSPDGPSVFAGRSEPNSYVTVLEGTAPVGSVKSDEFGEWSLSTEHRFSSLDPKLSFKVSKDAPPAPVAAAQAGNKPDDGVAAAKSPQEVSRDLIRKLEQMVADARKEAAEAPPAPAAAPPALAETPPAVAETQRQPEPKAAEAAPATVSPGVPAGNDAESRRAALVADYARRVAEAESGAAAPVAPKAPSGETESRSAAAATQPAAAPSTPPAQAPVVTDTVAPVRASAAREQVSIPVPIMFTYNEATFTDEGRRAADLLLEYLKLKRFDQITLSGHADERGSDAYNVDLSRERLDAVSRYLKDGGFAGQLDLLAKGKSEPFAGVDRHRFSGEALHQLDRRVELRYVR